MDRFGGDFGAYGDDDGYEDRFDESQADDGAHSNPPPSPVGQDERRMQVRAYNHWASLLGDQNLPHIEDLEPEFLGDFGPYSLLLDFSTGSGTPTIQYIGTQLRDECRVQDLVETFQDVPEKSLLARVAENYLQVLSAQAPVNFEAEAVNAKGHNIAYRGILLPYSSDHDTIDFVYAVVNWKEVADANTADALLNEIDVAMADRYGANQEPQVESEPVDTAKIVHFDRQIETDHGQETGFAEPLAAEQRGPSNIDDNIFKMRGTDMASDNAFEGLPEPKFGQAEENDTVAQTYEAAYTPDHHQPVESAPSVPKRNRSVDALGNPIGGAPQDDLDEEPASGGITTAADYGLPEWADEEEPEEDVDGLVNPLADIDLNSRLLSLVNAGNRVKKTIDLGSLGDTTDADEEENATEDREMFRPKAPSVDTFLTPEAYEESVEDEFQDYAYEPAPQETLAEESIDTVEQSVAAGPFAASDHDYASEGDLHAHSAEPDLNAEPVPCDESAGGYAPVSTDRFEEPLELSEDLIIEEAPQETVSGDATHTGVYENQDRSELLTETDEGSNWTGAVPSEMEFAAESEMVEETPVVVTENEHVHEQPVHEQPQQPESLHGLLAAVHELAEAARTTEDRSRRALYEAVGRAFDVSIKAVIAAESHGHEQRRVLEHLPVGDLAGDGPETALVMVRRTANGATEVIGEVPHDSVLMESAALKLAGK